MQLPPSNMSELTKPYCTLLDVQSENKNSEPENDPIYIDCINLASRYIDDKCRRNFWYTDATSTAYKVPRSSVIGNDILLPIPIIDIAEIRYMEDPTVTSSSAFALTEIDYYYEDGSNRISVSSTTPLGYPFEGRIELFGEFGYLLAEDENGDPILTEPPVGIPSAIRRATTIVAAAWSNQRRVENVALDGSKSLILDNTISKEVDVLLSPWVFRLKNNF